jgi:Uma2 family endonuclease
MPTIALPTRKTVILNFGYGSGLSLRDYFAFCRANPDLRCERTADGKVVILSPAGTEGAYRSGQAFLWLAGWAAQDGKGKAFDSSVKFLLPDGSALCPDAAWVSNEALRRLTRKERRQFSQLSPEFVIEVMSPSDRIKPAQAKMEAWISNGVQLAWLIDGDHETVYVYRKGGHPEVRRGIQEIAGEGPVKGFVLELGRIWQGLA